MLEISNVNVQTPSFKADNYQKQQAQMPLPPMSKDTFELMNAQKKEKSRDAWSKAGVIGSFLIGGAIIFSALMAHKTAKLAPKEIKMIMKDESKAGIEGEANGFYERFKNFKNDSSVVSVNEKSTDPDFAEQVLAIKRGLDMPEWLRKLTGVKPQAKFFYVHGPSGVGKSYGMEQLAKEIDANYLRVQFSDFGSEFQNKSGKNIQEFFDKLIATCKEKPNEKFVLNIDEADALFAKASSSNPNETLKFRSAFINAIDSAQKEAKNLIVGCTTNFGPTHPNIDAASLRRIPGKIEFKLPKQEQIESLIDIYTRGCGDIQSNKFIETNKDAIADLAKSLEEGQYGHGEIRDMINNALSKYADDALKNNITEATKDSMHFKMQYLLDAKNELAEAVAKKGTYTP